MTPFQTVLWVIVVMASSFAIIRAIYEWWGDRRGR